MTIGAVTMHDLVQGDARVTQGDARVTMHSALFFCVCLVVSVVFGCLGCLG